MDLRDVKIGDYKEISKEVALEVYNLDTDKEFLTKEDMKDFSHLTLANLPDGIIGNPFINKLIEDREDKLPCDKCSGSCCGPVPFSQEEFQRIFMKYQENEDFRDKFPFLRREVESLDLGLFFSFKEYMPGAWVPIFNKDQKKEMHQINCIFKKDEKTGGCLVYEDRPIVCRAFGNTDMVRCPFYGMKKEPTKKRIHRQLTTESQTFGMKRMMELMAEQKGESVNSSTKKKLALEL